MSDDEKICKTESDDEEILTGGDADPRLIKAHRLNRINGAFIVMGFGAVISVFAISAVDNCAQAFGNEPPMGGFVNWVLVVGAFFASLFIGKIAKSITNDADQLIRQVLLEKGVTVDDDAELAIKKTDKGLAVIRLAPLETQDEETH